MKVFIIWLIGVILWNFGYPTASPMEDVIAAVLLSLLSMYLKKFIKTTIAPTRPIQIIKFLRKIFLFLFAYKKPGKTKANTNKRYITDNISSLILKIF